MRTDFPQEAAVIATRAHGRLVGFADACSECRYIGVCHARASGRRARRASTPHGRRLPEYGFGAPQARLQAEAVRHCRGLFHTATVSQHPQEPPGRRLARSVPDARMIADSLAARGVRLQLGSSVHDPHDPMGRMFFNILATFAQFEADLLRLRTREGMAQARAKGRLKGKPPKLKERQARELARMHATGDYSISDLAEIFSVSRPTVYRTLKRQPPAT